MSGWRGGEGRGGEGRGGEGRGGEGRGGEGDGLLVWRCSNCHTIPEISLPVRLPVLEMVSSAHASFLE